MPRSASADVSLAMALLEARRLRRLSGPRIAAASLALGIAGVGPLLVYCAFGPKDGNPIGLGLLAVAAVPIAGAGVLVGLVKWLGEALRARA